MRSEGEKKKGWIGREKKKMGETKRDIEEMYIINFFFKQKTAYEIYQCDWSSDVCSSDLVRLALADGSLIQGKLIVAADGGRSWVRTQAGIGDRKSVV